MTTQEIATSQHQPPAIATDGAVGLSGEFWQQDMTIPICSLVQPMSQDKGEEGRFWFPDGRSVEELGVAVLDIMATRALWAPVDSGIGAPICRSVDRKEGITNYGAFIEKGGDVMKLAAQQGDAMYVPCSDCRFGPSATSFEKIDGLWCPYGYTLLLCDAENREAFLYFVKGAQMKSVKQRIVSPTLMRWNRTGKAEPWVTAYQLTPRLVEEKEKKRKYWVADIQPVAEFGEAERQELMELAMALRGRAIEQMEEEDFAAAMSGDGDQGALLQS